MNQENELQSENNLEIHNVDGALASKYVNTVSQAVIDNNLEKIEELTNELHAADFADLVELLPNDLLEGFVGILGRKINYEALTELDENLRDKIVKLLPVDTVAEAVSELDSDDAVYLIEDLDKEEQDEILAKVSVQDRIAVKRSLDYPEDSAGRLMQCNFVAIPADWPISKTIKYLRNNENLPGSFVEIFVIDTTFHLSGSVSLDKILQSNDNTKLSEIMDTENTVFSANDDQEEVAYKFEQYNLISAAVVDDDNRLVGMITIDDVVDVIRKEIAEDMSKIVGVSSSGITDNVYKTTTDRFTWLFINLITAIIASIAISFFDYAIEKMAPLAILMTVVASMGGNAATQTMTVAIRALATHDLGPVNAIRIFIRETLVGSINGLIFALITGLITIIWFQNIMLAIIISISMVINMVVAGVAGILIPMTLEKMRIDPAMASGVFVTTITDVIGFITFLGLAILFVV